MHPCHDILKTLKPDFVVDLGASDGRWSAEVTPIWPKARFILFEPIAEYRRARRSNWRWVSAAAGAAAGTVKLNVMGSLFGSGIYGHPGGREVPVRTVDSEIPDHGSLFLKLDTHGYETEVLRGAAEALKRAVGLQIEVYGRRLTPTAPLAWELIHELGTHHGFRPVAWFDQLDRPGTAELWQADVLFLREDHPLFKTNTFQ
jgi:FkbM family methyltransferase